MPTNNGTTIPEPSGAQHQPLASLLISDLQQRLHLLASLVM